jgi:hypothetical protein
MSNASDGYSIPQKMEDGYEKLAQYGEKTAKDPPSLR